jgi:ribosome-binding protein aMBF1 (putative translation factor)
LKRYVTGRKKRDREFAREYDLGYEHFKLGVVLRQARERAGLTQEEVARRMQTKKSAISRIENHAEDIKLSTLERFADAIGINLRLRVAG